MKETHFLYSIATIAFGSIIAIFVSYATNTLPTATLHTVPRAISTIPAKKDCGCCAKVTLRELETFQQLNEELRKRRDAYIKVTELLQQYGLQEGLRRIKQFDPEIATQLENFTKKDSVDPEH